MFCPPRVQVSVSAVRDGMGGMRLHVGGVIGEVWFGNRTTSSPEPKQVFCPPRVQVSVCAVRDGLGGLSLRVGGVVGEVWFGSRTASSPEPVHHGCRPMSVLSEMGWVE